MGSGSLRDPDPYRDPDPDEPVLLGESYVFSKNENISFEEKKLFMLEFGNQIPKWIRILNGIRIFFEIRIIDQKIRIPPDGSQKAKKIRIPDPGSRI